MIAKRIFYMLSLVLLYCACDANQNVNSSVARVPVAKAILVRTVNENISPSDTVFLTLDNKQYTLLSGGRINVYSDVTHRNVLFHLGTKLQVETVYFFYYGNNNLIVYYTDTDGKSGASFVECYDRINYKMRWQTAIGAYNLACPVVVRNMTYVASSGFVGKINLENGLCVWKYEKAYEQTRCYSLGSIGFVGNKVHFTEGYYLNQTKTPGSIIVDDSTGTVDKMLPPVLIADKRN